jgi:hypothetical protein
MFMTILWSMIAVAIAGIGVKIVLDRMETPQEITWVEYGIGMAISCLLVGPLIGHIGWSVAKSNLVTFNEYRNGWEVQATRQDIQCTKDGPCVHEYDCDPYQCNPHKCNCSCTSRNKDGSCASESCDTCYDTCYHDCPYVTTESSFYVTTTLGQFAISENRLPDNPDSYRWSRLVSVPGWLVNRAGTGIPQFWTDVQKRCSANNPGPVTKKYEYENYILASDRSILKSYSQDIDRFKSANLFPRLSHNVFSYYLADKVYFIGYQPKDATSWQDSVRYLNSALGSELQGDLHLVIVQNSTINSNPDIYALALKPYWQNKELFDRDVLSKNGIVVIIGTTDGQTIAWARTFTGMPIGNEEMLLALKNRLKGTTLDPASVVGTVRGQTNGKAIVGNHGSGVIETVLWGLNSPTTKFRRFSMKAQDKDDFGPGFLYLQGEIEPTGGQKFTIALITFFVCCLAWLAFALIGERSGGVKDFRQRFRARY